MNSFCRAVAAAALTVASVPFAIQPASAGVGDLLVAPTRLVLNGGRSAEVILNNIGDEPATYRISAEFRRMRPDGTLEEVAEPSDSEKAARDMLIFAPRRVTLAPREPQSVRIAARPAKGLPDGEYRVHLLFRAIPPSTPVTQAASAPANGLSFKLVPVYGVTIPVIVRLGNLQATAGIAGVRLEKQGDEEAVGLDLTRTGSRSTFGEVRVLKAGVKEPIALQRGVAIYTEVGKRHVSVPIQPDFRGKAAGPVTVEYLETTDDGSHLIASTQTVLR